MNRMLNDGRKAIFDLSAIESDLQVLADTSKNLNRLTDELTSYVELIESVVNDLNLGLAASVSVEEESDENGMCTHHVRLWYEKSDGRWGFSIHEFDDYVHDPDQTHNLRSWVFKDASRMLRLKVVDRIPELIKALAKEAAEMTAKTASTVSRAQAIASTLAKPSVTSNAAPAGPRK